LIGFFKKIIKSKKKSADRGIMVFENTSEVIRAENILKKTGRSVSVMGPPPEIRTGCDLVIEFPLIEELELKRELSKNNIFPIKTVPVGSGLLEPVSLFQTKDFGEFLMVRAANMKITISKNDRKIVNISGGGCPDVPYLAEIMTGKILEKAPNPRDLGHTLCGYALQLAYEEILKK
jgi:hypothetical protein